MILRGLFALVAIGLFAVTARAGKVEMKTLAKGSADDAEAVKAVPENGIITNEKDLEKLWAAWQIADKMPKVDFSKELVVVATWRGSSFNVTLNLDDSGNLAVQTLGTKDLRPGVRYVIGTVSHEGVKKVNGKDLPKE